jgi:hypothetical protein
MACTLLLVSLVGVSCREKRMLAHWRRECQTFFAPRRAETNDVAPLPRIARFRFCSRSSDKAEPRQQLTRKQHRPVEGSPSSSSTHADSARPWLAGVTTAGSAPSEYCPAASRSIERVAPLLRTQPAVRLDVSSSAGGVQIQVPLSKPPAFARPYSTTLALLSREQGGTASPRQGAVTRPSPG